LNRVSPVARLEDDALRFANGDVITEEVTGLSNVLKPFENVDEVNFMDW
jgi:hypothetical protein